MPLAYVECECCFEKHDSAEGMVEYDYLLFCNDDCKDRFIQDSLPEEEWADGDDIWCSQCMETLHFGSSFLDNGHDFFCDEVCQNKYYE